MRPAAGLPTEAGEPTAATAHILPAPQEGSPWRHSPVPYLFGGLAAMLGLIAFALLLLACSYWKLSGYPEGTSGGRHEGGDLAAAERKRKGAGARNSSAHPAEQRMLVIMAGEDKPTYLATPKRARAAAPFSGGDEEVKADQGSDRPRESPQETQQR